MSFSPTPIHSDYVWGGGAHTGLVWHWSECEREHGRRRYLLGTAGECLLYVRMYVCIYDYHIAVSIKALLRCVLLCVWLSYHRAIGSDVYVWRHRCEQCGAPVWICAPRVCMCVCMRAVVRSYVRVCVCACVRAFVRACVRACLNACAHVHACVRACLRACVRACMRACICACVYASLSQRMLW